MEHVYARQDIQYIEQLMLPALNARTTVLFVSRQMVWEYAKYVKIIIQSTCP